MVIVEFSDDTYLYLVQMLRKRLYQTVDMSEITMITKACKQLNFQSETWLSALEKDSAKIKENT